MTNHTNTNVNAPTLAEYLGLPAHDPSVAPTSVNVAKVVATVHAGLIAIIGVLLVASGAHVALGIASIVEGAIRLSLALALRQGASRTRVGLLIVSGIGVFAGVMSARVGLVGAAASATVIRCLQRDEAKAFLDA